MARANTNIERSLAKAENKTHYFNGVPCKRGGIGLRRVSNNSCECEICKEILLEKARKYKKNNREKINKQKAEYHKRNPHLYKEKKIKRKLKLKQSIPKWEKEWNQFALNEAYKLLKVRREQAGIEWDVDHMYPLKGETVCGFHCGDNIQVIPAEINNEKSNRFILTERYEWLK